MRDLSRNTAIIAIKCKEIQSSRDVSDYITDWLPNVWSLQVMHLIDITLTTIVNKLILCTYCYFNPCMLVGLFLFCWNPIFLMHLKVSVARLTSADFILKTQPSHNTESIVFFKSHNVLDAFWSSYALLCAEKTGVHRRDFRWRQELFWLL